MNTLLLLARATKRREPVVRPRPSWPRRAERASADGGKLVRVLAKDLVCVFDALAPEVDAVALGLAIAHEGQRREAEEIRAWGDRGTRGDAA